MSALFWLFGLGTLAIAFPLLFHLIRRTPKGQTQFSSLIFLKPSPPSLTRRSRLENLLLLLLRMAVVVLVALAFMRPFLRGADYLSLDEVASRRVAILLDTSASMQRGELWTQAKQKITDELDGIEPGDQVALFAFDEQVRALMDFDSGSSPDQVHRGREIQDSVDRIQPGDARSDLGKALVTVADQLAVWRDSQRGEDKTASAKLQIVVVSDLQKGSKTDLLQSYQWPADVFVDFRSVSPADTTNATVQVLNPVANDEQSLSRRVRVRNFEDSLEEQFFVNGLAGNQGPERNAVPFYVPPGTSRVLELDDSQALSANEFVLSGDHEEFDNSYYVVPPQKQLLSLAYLGEDDANDPEQLLFYLSRALVESATRVVEVRKIVEPTEEEPVPQDLISTATLLVIGSPVPDRMVDQVDEYLAADGTVLVVLQNLATVDATTRWTKVTSADPPQSGGESVPRYAMLANIDFQHPLFAPFDSPKFNDFTSIRFWNHRPVAWVDSEDGLQPRVIASFDDDSPAVWQLEPSTGGKIIVMASGWQPEDSQLALSTKFVPILNGLLDIAVAQPDFKRSYLVGEPIEFMPATGSVQMTKPDNTQVPLAPGTTRFAETDQAGIYRLKSENQDQSYAVNIDRAESETVPIPLEQLEMFQINVGRQQTAAIELEQQRQLRDRELEDQQKIWKWLIVAALAVLLAETLLAGRTASRDLTPNQTDEGLTVGVTGEIA